MRDPQTTTTTTETTTETRVPDEPRDYCFGGECATCDGHDGQCICACHAHGLGPDCEDAPLPTLDQMIARHIEEQQRTQQQEQEDARRELDGKRQDRITAFDVRLNQKFGGDLVDILDPTIGYDPDADTQNTDGYDPYGVSGPAATFTHAGHAWKLTRDYYHSDLIWMLRGPYDYTVQLAQDWDWCNPRPKLLEALAAFPAWLQDREQREREKAEKAAATAAEKQRRRDDHPLYAYTTADLANHPNLGMLHTGSRLWVTVETPSTGEYGEKTETHKAELIDWDTTWLLVNIDDDEFDQRLIPIARVAYLRTRD